MALSNESNSGTDELTVLNRVLDALKTLDDEARERILYTAATFFKMSLVSPTERGNLSRIHSSRLVESPSFSEDRDLSPKQFLLEKKPQTDVERVACLAYYLTHYRGTPHFKTLDISKLNTEAAQIKFSNTAVAVNNASRLNYLVAASRGNKQLSSLGEQFVLALPDRDRTKAVMAEARQRRRGLRFKQIDPRTERGD